VVQGTLGYFNLEYFHKYELIEKNGVYSFCVVLLELMTSLSAVDFNYDLGKGESTIVWLSFENLGVPFQSLFLVSLKIGLKYELLDYIECKFFSISNFKS
jgi:hypothetical protein